MILVLLIALPFVGGVAAWLLGRQSPAAARWMALGTMLAGLALTVGLWVAHVADLRAAAGGPWLERVQWEWIPQAGISFLLAVDGLSLLLIALCFFLGALAVLVSWREIEQRVASFHFHLLWSISGLVGVFLALDLFLFAFFFEVMLIPMYFLIAIWGHERRVYSAVKFFIFTQAGGLLMLIAILGLYFVHGRQSGVYTFDYFELLGTSMPGGTALWLMLGFFAAFAVKLPAVPLHTWLPDAHTQAPTAGSLILAGLLIKVGAYGMLRFQIPLFPQAAADLRPVAMWLGVAGILFGAVLAFGQTDLKRLVAYTSVSHMGFVLLGVFTWNERALQGVVLEVVCHALSTGGLFVLAGQVQERTGTRDLRRLGGAWSGSPVMGTAALIFALASLGLPGLGNFIAEFLILNGSYGVNRAATAVAAVGLVLAVVYSLWIVQRVFHGERRTLMADLSPREALTVGALIAPLLLTGLYPAPLLGTSRGAVRALQRQADLPTAPAPAWPAPGGGGGSTVTPGPTAGAQATLADRADRAAQATTAHTAGARATATRPTAAARARAAHIADPAERLARGAGEEASR